MLLLDYETFSEAKLGKSPDAVTAAAYAEHPSTEILCLGWKLDGGRTKLWTPDQRFPTELEDYFNGDGLVYAWNVGFEWAITRYVLNRDIGYRWRDIMAAVAYFSMPQSLDEFGQVAGLNVTKDKEGHRVMMKLCKPRKPSKNNPATRWTREAVPDDYNKLYAYCRRDIDTEYEAYKMLEEAPCLSF